MQYFASYYRQPDVDNATSVLLQQAYHKKRRMSVILACVSMEGDSFQANGFGNLKYGNVLLRELADWFYGTGLSLCSRSGEQGMGMIADSFAKNLNGILRDCAEIATCQWSGVLCVGQSILVFGQGKQQIRLLNTKNHRPYCHELRLQGGGTEGLNFRMGTIQRGVGVLLATEEFYRCIPVKKIEECLNVREMKSGEQVDRRLRELGYYGEEQGGTDLGSVLIVAR